jgi:hypothetical protein
MPYKIIDLGAQNGDFSQAFAINSQSQVTGWTGNPNIPNQQPSPAPFLWTQGGMQVLDIPNRYLYGKGFDLNCCDEVLGYLYDGSGDKAIIHHLDCRRGSTTALGWR